MLTICANFLPTPEIMLPFLFLTIILSANIFSGDAIQLIGCPHTILRLRCPGNNIIEVTSANYGRHSTSVCTDYPDPRAFQNTDCSLDERTMMANKCNGHQACDIAVDNQHIDPCVGTYKYITLDYICIQRPPSSTTTTAAPSPVACDANEEYGCDNLCSRHCQQPQNCSNTCENRCICKKGLKRDWTSGKCIDEKYCPSKDCDTHEVFSECNASCQRTCATPRSCCTNAPCVAGYVCAENYVRDTVTGKCVRPAQCPRQH